MAGLRDRVWLWRFQRWVTDREVAEPQPLSPIHLHAILCTWHEADVVAVTVRNALEQGCEAVHLLDNGSDDDTVRRAVEAGAVVEEVFTTDGYPQSVRRQLIETVVERVSRGSGNEHVWWLYLDADELVEGPEGSTVRELLEGLDRSFRVVGSETVNHYPQRSAPIAVGDDPRAYPSNEHARTGPACRQGHWKHPLLRWDADGPSVQASSGYHVAEADSRLVEPRRSLVSHHYPFRNRAATEGRLDLLQPRLAAHKWAMGRRRANLDAIYREAYDEVDTFDMVGPAQRLEPVPAPPVRPATP